MNGVSHYQSCFKEFVRTAAPFSRRQEAIDHFANAGFPTTKDEEWAFTNIAPLTRINFELATSTQASKIILTDKPVPSSHSDSEESVLIGPDDSIAPFRSALELIFFDGHLIPAPTPLVGVPAGVRVENLRDVLDDPHFGQAAATEGEAFTALNTAFVQDGAFIYLPPGVVVEQPIHLLFKSTCPNPNAVTYPRVLVVAEANTQATVVESYVGLDSEPYLTNSVSEFFVGPNAVLDHYRIQRESAAAFHIASTHVREERAAQFRSTAITLGGRLTRHHIHTALEGEGVDSTLNGLYIEDGAQHVDNHTLIEHAQPHCQSHEFYKGILGGRATGVFRGKIHVHQAAQKTDAYQANQNLLLSETAQINTKPQLEIYADDVKCSHGATIGQLDEDALFYLRSRGIGHREAVRVLTRAFAGEVLDRVRVPALKNQLDRLVDSRLDQAAAGVAL